MLHSCDACAHNNSCRKSRREEKSHPYFSSVRNSAISAQLAPISAQLALISAQLGLFEFISVFFITSLLEV